MAGFPFLQLNSTQLEKVIRKLKDKSYFRLQQTCRDMADCIRNNRNISKCVGARVEIFFWEDDGEMEIRAIPSFPYNVNNDTEISIESLFGVRFAEIALEDMEEEEFEIFCKKLKEYRISCTFLTMYSYEDKEEDYNLQFGEMLEMLKPEQVYMHSIGRNRFETLVACKELKELELHVCPHDVIAALKIASSCPDVELQSESRGHRDCDKQQFFNLLISILQFLCSESHTNLRVFKCVLSCDERLPRADEQLQQLQAFHPILLREEPHMEFDRLVYQCSLNQIGLTVELEWLDGIVLGNGVTIQYRRPVQPAVAP